MTIDQKDLDAGLRFEVEYWGGRQVDIAGAITGQRYSFSGSARIGFVDPRDAPQLLRNSMFRLKGTRMVSPGGTQ
jgi:hypothetical protein